ncbi:hypothetical protein HDK77DRAFT_487976 [Phyllosticta capitalensis]
MPKHLKEYLTFHPHAEAEACDQEFDAAAGMAVMRESAATFVQEASFWTESTRYRQWVDAKRANCKALVDGDGQTLVPEERVRIDASNDEDTLDRERFSKGSALQTRRLPTNHDPKPDYKGRQPESASELGGSQDSYSSMEPPAEFAAQYHADAVLMHLAREAFDLLLLYLDHHEAPYSNAQCVKLTDRSIAFKFDIWRDAERAVKHPKLASPLPNGSGRFATKRALAHPRSNAQLPPSLFNSFHPNTSQPSRWLPKDSSFTMPVQWTFENNCEILQSFSAVHWTGMVKDESF